MLGALAVGAYGAFIGGYAASILWLQIASISLYGVLVLATLVLIAWDIVNGRIRGWCVFLPFPAIIVAHVFFYGALVALLDFVNTDSFNVVSRVWTFPWAGAIDATIGTGLGIIEPKSEAAQIVIAIAQWTTAVVNWSVVPLALAFVTPILMPLIERLNKQSMYRHI